jgi:hypothetical protein
MPDECRNPETATVIWMPACAGMTDILYFFAVFIAPGVYRVGDAQGVPYWMSITSYARGY